MLRSQATLVYVFKPPDNNREPAKATQSKNALYSLALNHLKVRIINRLPAAFYDMICIQLFSLVWSNLIYITKRFLCE